MWQTCISPPVWIWRRLQYEGGNHKQHVGRPSFRSHVGDDDYDYEEDDDDDHDACPYDPRFLLHPTT